MGLQPGNLAARRSGNLCILSDTCPLNAALTLNCGGFDLGLSHSKFMSVGVLVALTQNYDHEIQAINNLL